MAINIVVVSTLCLQSGLLARGDFERRSVGNSFDKC